MATKPRYTKAQYLQDMAKLIAATKSTAPKLIDWLRSIKALADHATATETPRQSK